MAQRLLEQHPDDYGRLIARRTRLLGKQADLFPNWQYFAFATNRTAPVTAWRRLPPNTPIGSVVRA